MISKLSPILAQVEDVPKASGFEHTPKFAADRLASAHAAARKQYNEAQKVVKDPAPRPHSCAMDDVSSTFKELQEAHKLTLQYVGLSRRHT